MRKPGAGVQEIFASLVILLIVAVIALVCLLPAFTIWVIRLNTFCQTICTLPGGNSENQLSIEKLKELFAISHKEISSRKGFLTQFYFLISLGMIPPTFVWVVLIGITVLPMVSPSLFGAAGPENPMTTTAMFFAGVITAYLVGLTGIAVVVSSVPQKSAANAAWQAIKFSVQHFVPLTLLSALILFVMICLTEPQTLCSFWSELSKAKTNQGVSSLMETSMSVTQANIGWNFLSEVWDGMTKVILLPFSLIPYCDMFRHVQSANEQRETLGNPAK